jgi:hypothetical protein
LTKRCGIAAAIAISLAEILLPFPVLTTCMFDTFSQLGRKMIHVSGEGDNVKHLAVVGGCSAIGLLAAMYVTNPLLLHALPSHIACHRELFNIFGNRKTPGR